MENLISVFMNYKVNRLVEYGVLIDGRDSKFVREVWEHYFRTFIDNYYYQIFHTIDADHFTEKNLKDELIGAKEEMLDDYREFELQVSNEEYSGNQQIIQELEPLAFDICKIELLKYEDKSSIPEVVTHFIEQHEELKSRLDTRLSKLITLVRETITTCDKMIHYEDNYYTLSEKKFENYDNIRYIELIPQIKVLDVYKKGMITKIYQDSKLDAKKMECFLQKVSLYILKKVLAKEEINQLIIRVDSPFVSRGKFDPKMYPLMDNPLFRKYVVIGVPYNTYLSQKEAFADDFVFACIQDFSHISDIYQKIFNIYQEGVFDYLIVEDCRYREREFFLKYDQNVLKVLVFEEE